MHNHPYIGRVDWPTLEESQRPRRTDPHPIGVYYTLGSLGVTWLWEHAGDDTVVEFFRRMARAQNWRDAFEGAFGLTIDDFHEQFEAYRAEAAPLLPHLTDDKAEPLLVFTGEVPTESEQAVREKFGSLHAFFSEQLGVVEADYTVFAGAEEAAVVSAHERAFGDAPPEEFCGRQTGGSVAVLDLGCEDGHAGALFGVHYDAAVLELAPSASLPRTSTGSRSRGPHWLTSPSRTYVKYGYDVATRREGADDTRNQQLARAAQTTRSLKSMATSDGYNENSSESLAVGFLALELLAEHAGDAALFEYYRRLPDSSRWEEAFRGAFGMGVSDFYRAFKAYRTEAVPPLPHLEDSRDEPLLVFVGDVSSDARAEIRNEFESLQTFFDRRLRAGAADYTVFAGVDDASVAAAHQRAFGEAPADEFCSRRTGGRVAVLNLDCDRQDPVETLLRVRFDAVIEHLTPWNSLPRPASGFSRRGPSWLVSPTHQYVSYAYQVASGRDEADDTRGRQVARAGQTTRLLSNMETSGGFNEDYWESIGVGFLALELLAERAGDAALFDYYRRLPGSESWEEAFEGAFGMAVDDFYEAFEAHRAQVAAPLPHLTDDIDAPVLLFVGELPAATRNELRQDFDAVQAFFRDRLGAPSADYTVYIGADARSLRDVYRQIDGRESTQSSYCSVPRGIVILISLQCQPDLAWRHSLFVLSGLRVPGLAATPAGYPSLGPAWLTTGGHSYVSGLYKDATGSAELKRTRSANIQNAARTRQPLSSLATSDGFADGSTAGRALGFLAVDWLFERAGETALFEYYRLLPESETWEEAFEAAFGIAVDDFYEAFEAYRAGVAPPLPHLTDNSDEPVLMFIGDVPAETEAAVRAEFDEVQKHFRQRLGVGTADYTLYIGATRDEMVDAYRRVFGADPSERFCEHSSHPGFAVINLGCSGAAPFRLDAHHFVEIRERLAPVASIPSTPAGFDRRGPVWLRNGAQWYVEHAYRVARGLEDVDASRNREAHRAVQTTRSLSSTSTWSGYNENSLASRGLAFLALEWLTDRAGDPALFDYYRLLTESETWEEAFEAAFDISIDDFYDAFEEYRAEVAPPTS